MPSQRYLLALQSTYDGPVSNVVALKHIEVQGSSDSDVIGIEVNGTTLAQLTGSGMHPVSLPSGSVRVRRIEGDTELTVFGWG